MRVLESFSLAGKTAVLTGGAGLYGTQIAQALYEAGARVFIASTNLPVLEQAAQAMRAEGGDVTALRLDLEEEASILTLCDEVCVQAGQVHILVNNAVARPMGGFHAPLADFDRSMRINATGTFALSRAFGDKMAEQGGGSIINISSIQGVVGPDPGMYEGLDMLSLVPDYYVHKGGLLQMTRFFASYYGRCGVRCNAISPGGFLSGQPEEFIGRYNAHTMLGRMAGTEDLKGAVVFLASDASGYVTAANLMVDGGYVAK